MMKAQRIKSEAFSIGLFIRRYLLERGKAYSYEVFSVLRRALLAQGYVKRGSYQNTRNYFRWLGELGLIR
jgi:hypothetical protein